MQSPTRQRYRQKGLCPRCGNEIDDKAFKSCSICREYFRKKTAGYVRKDLKKHQAYNAKWKRENTQRLKAVAYRRYGSVCYCCGESEPFFLTLDHINNDGADHRRKLGGQQGGKNATGSRQLYEWLRRNNYPSGFRVSCQNCNSGRYRNGGICPHLTQSKALAAKL